MEPIAHTSLRKTVRGSLFPSSSVLLKVLTRKHEQDTDFWKKNNPRLQPECKFFSCFQADEVSAKTNPTIFPALPLWHPRVNCPFFHRAKVTVFRRQTAAEVLLPHCLRLLLSAVSFPFLKISKRAFCPMFSTQTGHRPSSRFQRRKGTRAVYRTFSLAGEDPRRARTRSGRSG